MLFSGQQTGEEEVMNLKKMISCLVGESLSFSPALLVSFSEQ